MDRKKVEEVYNNTYLRINTVLLTITGLWPYRSQNEKLLCRVIVFTTMLLCLFPNANAARIWCGVDFLLCGENIVASLYSVVIMIKYYTTVLKQPELVKIHQQVTNIWTTITNADERSILTDYATHGKILSIGYVVYMISAGFVFSQAPILPVVLDFIFPLNHSRQKILVIKGEYFIDPFEYYYELYVAYCIGAVVSVSVLISIDTTYSAVVHQNLGILSIIKHRLHLAPKYSNESKHIAYKTVVQIVELHKSALEFIDLIESSYTICFMAIFFCFVISLSLGTIIVMENFDQTFELLRMSIIEFGILIHMFYLTYPGQQIHDHSSVIFLHVYMNKWYFLPQKAKTLLQIMMIRCLKASTLTVGKFYVLNYQNYGNIIKTTLSYITVLASFKD